MTTRSTADIVADLTDGSDLWRIHSVRLGARVLREAADRLAELEATVGRLTEALSFYADPGTYHACAFRFDQPAGGFDGDFADDHGEAFYDRPMPGKLAREALRAVKQ